MSAVTVRQDRTDLIVQAPYDAQFVTGAKALGGRWNPEARSWSVLLRCYRQDGGLPAPVEVSRRPARLPSADEVERILAGACPGWAAAA